MDSGSASSSGASIGQSLNNAAAKIIGAKATAIANQATAPTPAPGSPQAVSTTRGQFSLGGGRTGILLLVVLVAVVVGVGFARRKG